MEGLFGLLLLYGVLALIGAAQRAGKGKGKGRRPPPRPEPETELPALPELPAPGGGTRSEGFDLDRWLRQLEGEVPAPEGGTGPRGRPADRALPEAEEVEERETLETVPVVVPHEYVERPERVKFDYDASAKRTVARRIAEAEERDHALTLADHRRFDARIRAPQPPTTPDVVRTSIQKALTGASLRQAIILREVLGPPVSERGEPRDFE